MHVDHVFFAQGHSRAVASPVRIGFDEADALGMVLCMYQGPPGFGYHYVSIFKSVFEAVGYLEPCSSLFRVLSGPCLDLGIETELGRIGQRHVHSEAGHHQDQALGNREGAHIVGRAGPGHTQLQPPGFPKTLPNREIIRQDLARMVHIALHAEEGYAGVLCHFPQIRVTLVMGAVPNGNSLTVSGQHVGGVLCILAMADLHSVGR